VEADLGDRAGPAAIVTVAGLASAVAEAKKRRKKDAVPRKR
jgi:hypothetical protein